MPRQNKPTTIPDENYYAYKHHRLARLTNLAATITHALIKWGSLALIAYLFVDGLKSLAGRETLANIVITLAGRVRADQWIALILAGGGITYGINERRNRRKAVKNLTGRITQLEGLVDPKRTSSGLPPPAERDPEIQL